MREPFRFKNKKIQLVVTTLFMIAAGFIIGLLYNLSNKLTSSSQLDFYEIAGISVFCGFFHVVYSLFDGLAKKQKTKKKR